MAVSPMIWLNFDGDEMWLILFISLPARILIPLRQMALSLPLPHSLSHLMPLTEQTITTGGTLSDASITTAGQALEFAIPADDTENVADAGPADIGRADVHLKLEDQAIAAQ